MAVDEVGEGSLLGGSPKPEAAKKRLSSAGSNSSQAESNRPPRRKAGPISSDSLSKWRRRWRREMSSASSVASSASSTISSMSDLDSAPASPYSADLCSGDNQTEPSTSSLNGSVDEKLNGELRSRKRSASASRFSPPAEKKSREDEVKTRLGESTLKEKKILMGRFVRKLAREEKMDTTAPKEENTAAAATALVDNSSTNSAIAGLASQQTQSQMTSGGGSVLDKLLPAKQSEMDDKAGVKKLGGWDSLAKKSQSGGLSLDTSVQFELFRKQAKEKEEKRKQLRVEEERKRRLKEQEEKERARDQAAAESAELELKRQNELLRQKEQVFLLCFRLFLRFLTPFWILRVLEK
ncbi:unnamed protein product [Gongylonema pulchrum]|uniref:Uncharacterized protein n=1 Tax=Gongylonema pulchrum TaxID=637853 RepID=A0A183E373_9BILA|nr:unnamed protein product [Gongylonema pulchrum]